MFFNIKGQICGVGYGMRTNEVFKRSFNRCLDMLVQARPGDALPGENALAAALDVSRTTVRSVLTGLGDRQIIQIDGRARHVLRPPRPSDYYVDSEVEPVGDVVERKFMAWMVGPECRPGQAINGLDLARQFGTSTSAIRDCLNKFSHYGLLERQSNGRWKALGLTEDFVTELFDMREVMEFKAVAKFVMLPPDHGAWDRLRELKADHQSLLGRIKTDFQDFSELDHDFHAMINSVAPNRFFTNIHGVMSVIFHYHYQWNKRDERERNAVAVEEHLAYIAGLQSRDPEQARDACALHLKTARSTLMSSIAIEAAAEEPVSASGG